MENNNDKGQVTSKLFTEGSLIQNLRTQLETNTYDTRGRLLTHTATPGPLTAYSYGNRSVTSTANGRSHTERYNAWGNVTYANDPVSYVSYQYASCGKPIRAATYGATITMTYDACGNQTSLSDPDAGLQGYTYDALGRVASQSDGNGILTSNTYNTRGELTATTIGSAATTYTYGTGTTDNGLLLSMNRGYFTAAYQYDSFGRVTQETRSYGPTVSRTISQTYNAQGHMATRTYPGNLTISYEYDSYGNLLRMKHGTNTIYEVTACDGTLMTEALGPYMRRYSTFDNAGRLTHSVVQIGSLQEDTIASQSYTYDNGTGNLLSRTVGERETEEFTYDAVDRLTRVDYDGGRQTNLYYDANGNIDSKYGTASRIGSYYYDSSSPHAVTDVEDPLNAVNLPSSYVTVTYNELGKVSLINDNNYPTAPLRYLYGPDHERWQASGVKTGSAAGSVSGIRYFGDYEERFSSSTVQRRFVYLDGGVLAVATGNGSYEFYYIHTDHQGTIFAITDEDGDAVFRATYDAWGRQTVQQNDIAFFRGYTGHEMVEQGCLINMNGRLYDPCLGLFLSPDNYVQQPTNSQNFNRYSYCLNNPLKYTDPSGDLFGLSFLSGFIRGFIKIFDGGNISSPITYAIKNTVNDIKITYGLIKGSPKQLLSRLTWESPQTMLGYLYSEIRLVLEEVDHVKYFDGATFVINTKSHYQRGVTIGNFININDRMSIPVDEKGNFAPQKNPLYMHEYGHYLQSQEYGLGYLVSVGFPSLISAATANKLSLPPFSTHNEKWFEKSANRKASDYFRIKYNVDWNSNYIPPYWPMWKKRQYSNITIKDLYPL